MHYKQFKTILSPNNGMNLYRGCLHGCIYCDARSDCYQMTHDFEDIEIKENAPAMLEQELKHKRKKGMIATGAMSDPYLPLEEELRYTRQCLEVILANGFGVTLQTKSARILRDLDLIEAININTRAVVQMTLTTYDEALCRVIEPHVSTTKERYEALCTFRDHQIPTVVWLSPLLPFINDTEENLQGILNYCIDVKVSGIINFGFGVTLRDGDREYFYQQLDRYFPGMKERYISTYGNAYACNSINNRKLMRLFRDTCSTHHIMHDPQEIFAWLRQFPEKKTAEQLRLF